MVGAGVSAAKPLSYLERFEKAISAGCDIALLCNKPDEVDVLLSQIKPSDINIVPTDINLTFENPKVNEVNHQEKVSSAKDIIKKIKIWKSA